MISLRVWGRDLVKSLKRSKLKVSIPIFKNLKGYKYNNYAKIYYYIYMFSDLHMWIAN